MVLDCSYLGVHLGQNMSLCGSASVVAELQYHLHSILHDLRSIPGRTRRLHLLASVLRRWIAYSDFSLADTFP